MGRQYELVAYRKCWGEHRVYFHDENGALVLLPAGWTDAVGCDPFVELAGGRAHFRPDDLLRLADLIAGRAWEARPETVMEITSDV